MTDTCQMFEVGSGCGGEWQLDSASQKLNLTRRVESRALADDEADLEDGPAIGWEEGCGQCDEQLNPKGGGASCG